MSNLGEYLLIFKFKFMHYCSIGLVILKEYVNRLLSIKKWQQKIIDLFGRESVREIGCRRNDFFILIFSCVQFGMGTLGTYSYSNSNLCIFVDLALYVATGDHNFSIPKKEREMLLVSCLLLYSVYKPPNGSRKYKNMSWF